MRVQALVEVISVKAVGVVPLVTIIDIKADLEDVKNIKGTENVERVEEKVVAVMAGVVEAIPKVLSTWDGQLVGPASSTRRRRMVHIILCDQEPVPMSVLPPEFSTRARCRHVSHG